MGFFLQEQVTFRDEQLDVYVDRYANNNNIVLLLATGKDVEEVYLVATVNTGTKLNDDRVAIKDYSENSGVTGSLVESGIVTMRGAEYEASGFVTVPILKLTDSVVKQIKDNIELELI